MVHWQSDNLYLLRFKVGTWWGGSAIYSCHYITITTTTTLMQRRKINNVQYRMATVWTPASTFTPSDTISQLQFGPEDLLAVVSWDGCVQISTPKGEWSAQWRTSRPQFGMNWSSNDPKLYFGGAESRVSVIDCTFERQHDIIETESIVTSLASTPNLLAVGTGNSAIFFDHRIIYTKSVSTVASPLGVVDLDVDSSGTLFVAASVDGYCRVWDSRKLDTPIATRKPLSSNSAFLKVKFSEEGEYYAVSNTESHVAIEYHDRPDKSFVFKTNRITQQGGRSRLFPVYGLDFRPNELTTAGGDKSLYIWDIEQRKLRRQVSFSMPCMSVSYSKNDRYCAVGLSNDEWMNTPGKYLESSHAKVIIGELN